MKTALLFVYNPKMNRLLDSYIKFVFRNPRFPFPYAHPERLTTRVAIIVSLYRFGSVIDALAGANKLDITANIILRHIRLIVVTLCTPVIMGRICQLSVAFLPLLHRRFTPHRPTVACSTRRCPPNPRLALAPSTIHQTPLLNPNLERVSSRLGRNSSKINAQVQQMRQAQT